MTQKSHIVHFICRGLAEVDWSASICDQYEGGPSLRRTRQMGAQGQVKQADIGLTTDGRRTNNDRPGTVPQVQYPEKFTRD